MGILGKLLPIAGAAAGFAVGGPGGAKIGAALGGAAGGALSKSKASSKATKAQLAAIAEARAASTKAYEDVKGYQAPGLSTYQPGVNALTSRLGVSMPAPTNALTAAPGGAGLDPTGRVSDTFIPNSAAPFDGRVAARATMGAKASKVNGGLPTSPLEPDPTAYDPAARDAARSAPAANALTAPTGGADPGTYGDSTAGRAPTPYQAAAAPAAFVGPAPFVGPGAFNFTGADLRSLPGYQWQQDEARRGVLASSSATGALQSGAALKALSDRAQNIADLTFSRERDFAYGARNNERDFAYGVYDDSRDFDYRSSRDARGDYEDNRNFGYGQSRDARSDYQDTRNYLTDRFDTQTNNLFRYTDIGRGAADVLSGAATGYGRDMADLALGGGEARATNALTKGQIGADFAGDLAGTIAGAFKGGGASKSYAPRIFG
jgi:hypothetical protein